MIRYNNELQKIDTIEKAYLLGFIYADGCITEKNKNQLHTRISIVDEELILNLHKYFPFFNREEFDFSKYNKNCKKQYGLRKTSKELYNDLYLNGVHPRKSGENKDKVYLPNLDEALMSHFIRGYFDGDGSISIAKNRPNLRRVEICSVSKNLLLQIQKHLRNLGIINKDVRSKKIAKTSKLQLHVIEWINSENILKLRDYLYKDATVYLERKKKLFDSFKIIRIEDKNPECPYCKTKTCIKRASRIMQYGIAYRFKCKNCNKGFTKKAQVKSDKLLENPEEDNQQPI